MDVLIVERDELLASMLVDTLETEGISVGVASDEETLKLRPNDRPLVVITGINRGHDEDLTGLKVVSVMRRQWPQLCAIYLSAIWPACLRPDMMAAGERFLTKPVRLGLMIRTVRELLDSGLCGPSGSPPSRMIASNR